MGSVASSTPDLAELRSLDDLIGQLRALRAHAGNPSFAEIVRRIATRRRARGRPESERRPGRVTVYECFQPGRRRLDVELLADIVEALGGPDAEPWRRAYGVLSGDASAATMVDALDRLPADVAAFTGRRGELEAIVGRAASGAVVISAVEGMAGIGKTSLAVRAAHRLRDRLGAAALFVNLRGYEPDAEPADPQAVLGSFLGLLGVPRDQFQYLDLHQRAATYRRILSNRRMVIVLDNAASEEQIWPLLPDSSACAVLVTSRRRLDGLRGAAHIALDVFSRIEALAYLRSVVGAERIAAEPEAATELTILCGCLPLDLAVTAAELLRKPAWSLVDHVQRLASFPRDVAVRPAFAASYSSLSPPAQRMFRKLALHPGRHAIDAWAAAALLNVDVEAAEPVLAELATEHMLQVAAPGRYGFHDVVLAYAERMVRIEDPPSEHRAARGRLLEHYVQTAAAAMDLAAPYDSELRPDVDVTPAVTDRFTDREQAYAWLNDERANLIAVGVQAAEQDRPDRAFSLAATLDRYLVRVAPEGALRLLRRVLSTTTDHTQRRQLLISFSWAHLYSGFHREAIEHMRRALDLTREAGDDGAQCRILRYLSQMESGTGDRAAAVEYARDSLRQARAARRADLEVEALYQLGEAAAAGGDYRTGLAFFEECAALSRQLGDEVRETFAVGAIGQTCLYFHRFDEGLDHARRSLVIARRLRHAALEIAALAVVGRALRGLGRYAEAVQQHQLALQLATSSGDCALQGVVLTDLGSDYLELAEFDLAADHHHRALAIAGDVADPLLEQACLNGLGEAAADPERALDRHRQAIALGRQQDGLEWARAQVGVARILAGRPDRGAAAGHWRKALEVYAALGVPEADEAREELRALGAALTVPGRTDGV